MYQRAKTSPAPDPKANQTVTPDEESISNAARVSELGIRPQREGPGLSMLDAAAEEVGADGDATTELNPKLDRIVLGKEGSATDCEELADLFKRGFSRSRSDEAESSRAFLVAVLAEYGADFEQVRNNWKKHPRRQDDPALVRESLVAGLIRNQLDPEREVDNGILDSVEMEASKDLSMLLTYAMNGKLKKWIGEDEDRKARAVSWFEDLVPDVSEAENNGGKDKEEGGVELAGVNAAVASFTDWDAFEYDVIIVPGFTPRPGLEEDMVEAMDPERKAEDPELARMSETWGDDIRLHPTAVDRLKMAVADFRDGKAPFVLLTGSNVWPKGSGIYEAIEMKKWLIQHEGVPADRIIVDAKAKHSTTNIRNAGRYMLDHGMKKALVTTSGGQNFYFGHNILSSYAFRALGDMGAVPKMWIKDAHHSVFKPGAGMQRKSLTDPSDM